jgi:hypothetical protein
LELTKNNRQITYKNHRKFQIFQHRQESKNTIEGSSKLNSKPVLTFPLWNNFLSKKLSSQLNRSLSIKKTMDKSREHITSNRNTISPFWGWENLLSDFRIRCSCRILVNSRQRNRQSIRSVRIDSHAYFTPRLVARRKKSSTLTC